MKLVRAILDQVCSVHEILPLWSRTYQWTVKYNFLYGKINLDRILWHYGSMQFGSFIQNPVQDSWAALLCELVRIESTVYFSQNLLVMITKWSVNCQVQFCVRDSLSTVRFFFLGKCLTTRVLFAEFMILDSLLLHWRYQVRGGYVEVSFIPLLIVVHVFSCMFVCILCL